uniref:Uncharacterized protein n=1 Tax=viral metagenome TaxID=1070528 RepID=A0A6H1ZQ43_9ZZZZ
MTWIIENYTFLIAIIGGVVTTASIIAKLTPTKVDDNFFGFLIKLMDKLALNNTPTETRKIIRKP